MVTLSMSMQKGGRTGSPRNPAFAACKGTGGSREPSVPAGIDAELGKSRQVEKEAEWVASFWRLGLGRVARANYLFYQLGQSLQV